MMRPSASSSVSAQARAAAREAVGPFLGELPGLAEDDRHVRPADLDFRQAVGDQCGPDPVELEDGRIAVLDHDRGPGQRGHLGQGVAELAAGQAGYQVNQGLPFHRGDQPPVVDDPVVTARQRPPEHGGLLPAEPVRVLLVAVGHDLQVRDPGRAGRGGAHVRPGLLAGPGRLPEHRVPAAGLGEDQLRPVLPAPIQDQVDGGAPAHARAQPDPLDDLRVGRPFLDRGGGSSRAPWSAATSRRCGTPSRRRAGAASGTAAWNPDRG